MSRQVVTFADGSQSLFCDVTAVVQQTGVSTGFDWIELVRLGQAADHDTLKSQLDDP